MGFYDGVNCLKYKNISMEKVGGEQPLLSSTIFHTNALNFLKIQNEV